MGWADPVITMCMLCVLLPHQSYGTVLFALSSSTFAHLSAKDGNQSAVTLLNPLQSDEVMAFQRSLEPGQWRDTVAEPH